MSANANVDIYKELRRRIVNIEYSPGDAINEKELAAEFGVSRTPVREAVLKLSQNGLIDLIPRVGTFVTRVDVEAVKYAYEVKLKLEGFASELAATRATNEQIQELFDIVERFKGYNLKDDYSLCIQDDQRFHQIIREASGNQILIEMLEELNIKTARFLQHIKYVIEDANWFTQSLTDMAEGIYKRDPELARIKTEEHTRTLLGQMSLKFFLQ